LSEVGDGSYVAIAYGGEGHNGPVYSFGYARKITVYIPFYGIHKSSKNDGSDENKEHEYHYFS
jgi:hypothetical protein